jgi:arsenite/tail-anchored protein-transporting ATPase
MRDLLDRRVLLFGGKGGVGKTTCAAAMALGASREGKQVLLVSTDPAHSTSDILGLTLGPEPTRVSAGLHAIELDAGHEATRFLTTVRTQMSTLFSPAVLAKVAKLSNSRRRCRVWSTSRCSIAWRT